MRGGELANAQTTMDQVMGADLAAMDLEFRHHLAALAGIRPTKDSTDVKATLPFADGFSQMLGWMKSAEVSKSPPSANEG